MTVEATHPQEEDPVTLHHSHHHAPLCAAPHCRTRGQHTTDCPGGDCRAYLARHHETEETR